MNAASSRSLLSASEQDYHSFSRVKNGASCVSAVEAEFLHWLSEKGISLSDGTQRTNSGTAKVTVESGKNGAFDLVLCRLVEDTPAGRFTTEIYASSEGWINVSVRSAEGKFVSVPRIAKALMRRLDLFDATLQFLDKPMTWDVDKVDELVELLEDSDRHGPVFVVGSRDAEKELFGGFQKYLPLWAREVYGLAQTIILTPAATLELASRFGHYGVSPWTLRTYFPGVDRMSSVDSARHRYIRTERLAGQKPAAVARLLGNSARRHAATRTEPMELVFAKRLFMRAATQRLITQIEKPQPKPQPKPSNVVTKNDEDTQGNPATSVDKPQKIEATDEPRTQAPAEKPGVDQSALNKLHGQLDLVRMILGINDLTESAIREAAARIAPADNSLSDEAIETIESQLQQIEGLEDELREVTASLNDIEIEQAEYQEDLQKRQSEIRWLRGRLRDANDYEGANGESPVDEEWERPGSCRDVLENIATDSLLVFTGDYRHVDYIDNRDQLGRAAFNLHHACAALTNYATAKLDSGFTGDVEEYLRNHQSGASSISAAKHAMNESKVTLGQWGNEREFKVPKEVDTREKALMVAHFRLHRAGMGSARMHYLDDVVRSGKIYIGYVGPHLTNTQTN